MTICWGNSGCSFIYNFLFQLISGRAVECVLVRKSNQGSRKHRKKEEKTMLQALQKSDRGESLTWRDVSYFLRHIEIFCILILFCKFTFILMVVAAIGLTFVPFQEPHHCILLYFGGNYKSRGFYYSVSVIQLQHLALLTLKNRIMRVVSHRPLENSIKSFWHILYIFNFIFWFHKSEKFNKLSEVLTEDLWIFNLLFHARKQRARVSTLALRNCWNILTNEIILFFKTIEHILLNQSEN